MDIPWSVLSPVSHVPIDGRCVSRKINARTRRAPYGEANAFETLNSGE